MSQVHRIGNAGHRLEANKVGALRRPCHTIAIRRSGPGNQVEAFDFFIGLFTSRAYAEESQHIPLLRTKLRQVIDSEHAVPGSHDYKGLVATFNSFPKEELFRASTVELLEQLHVILDLKNESAVRLKTLADVQRGMVIALVVMPREGFAADVRVRIQQALADGLNGSLMYYVLALGEGYTARLHFCFDADPPKPATIRELESHVKQLAHRWEDRLQELLLAKLGTHRGHEIWARWAGAFGAEYQAVTSAERAATDVERIEALMSEGRSFAAEVAPACADSDQLRMAGIGDPPALSELMPILQNFGLAVLSEDSHVCRPQLGARRAYVEEFSVRGADGQPLRDLPGAGFLADAIVAVRSGQTEDDPLNALVLTAVLRWREVALLRAYLAAAFQMRLAPARPTLRHALVTYPQLVLGGDIAVPHVSGSLSLRLPAGTQSGQVFTLRGRGLPRVNASGTGDLHVRVQLWTPSSMNAEQKKALEGLRAVESAPPASRPKDLWSWLKDALGA